MREVIETEKKNSGKRISRRKALLATLIAGVSAAVKEAWAANGACACLPAPDCNAICPNGGVPLGDGTQSCLCSNTPLKEFAPVAYTGSYNDLLEKPSMSDINSLFEDTVVAGQAGPVSDLILTETVKSKEMVVTPHSGSILIPYFTVNDKGLVTAYGSRTLKFA